MISQVALALLIAAYGLVGTGAAGHLQDLKRPWLQQLVLFLCWPMLLLICAGYRVARFIDQILKEEP